MNLIINLLLASPRKLCMYYVRTKFLKSKLPLLIFLIWQQNKPDSSGEDADLLPGTYKLLHYTPQLPIHSSIHTHVHTLIMKELRNKEQHSGKTIKKPDKDTKIRLA